MEKSVPDLKKRDITLSIVKGIGILLMVVGHASHTSSLTKFVYLFHMPLFFIASGYFFSTKYTVKDFIVKRIKGLYFPYVKWSIIFLLLHNLFLKVGVLSTVMGNEAGYASTYYTYKDILIKMWRIVSTMGSHDSFLLGAFWFLKALFISSIVFCVCFYLLKKFTKLTNTQNAIIICVVFFLLNLLKLFFKINILLDPQQILGVFFFGIGFISRDIMNFFKRKISLLVALLFLILLLVQSKYYWANMHFDTYPQFFIISYTGIVGWFMTYCISYHIKSVKGLSGVMNYLGENTMPIVTFHFLAFKIVSLIKVLYYHLDYSYIGCHPVIWEHQNLFWMILYTITAISVSLLLAKVFDKIKFLSFKNL